MIPKVIHYCWFCNKKLPDRVKKNIDSWKKYCPDFKIIEWNEKNFDIKGNSFVAQAYKDKAWAFVSDYARLDIIYKYGGIYLDTDVEIIKNLDDLLRNHAFIGLQRQNLLCASGLGIGAEVGNPVIKKMRDIYLDLDFDSFNSKNITTIAAPELNDSVIRKLGYTNNLRSPVKLKSITVYPPTFFDPFSPGFVDDLMSESTYTIHHYDASWLGYRTRIQRKVVQIVGQKRINKFKKILSKFH